MSKSSEDLNYLVTLIEKTKLEKFIFFKKSLKRF
jgi:hypothetical protein